MNESEFRVKNDHYQWLQDIFNEVNDMDSMLLHQAIKNVKNREVIE